MPVDKFGRSGNTSASVGASVGASVSVSINTVNNHFLRRNGKNTVLRLVDMAGNGLKNVGDLLLPVGTDTVRELGCVDLTEGKGFSLPLGNRQNMLCFNIVEPSKPQQPVTLQTSHGFTVKANGENVIQLGGEEIIVHKRIRSLSEPDQDDEAVSKGYVDRKLLQMTNRLKPVITIWAERYGPINSFQYERSFGSSAAGGKGHRKLRYVMMAHGRVLRVKMSAHVDGRPVDGAARVTMAVNERGRGLDYSVLIAANNYHGTTVFDTPLELLNGMRINFQSYSNNPAVTSAVVSLLIELDIVE